MSIAEQLYADFLEVNPHLTDNNKNKLMYQIKKNSETS